MGEDKNSDKAQKRASIWLCVVQKQSLYLGHSHDYLCTIFISLRPCGCRALRARMFLAYGSVLHILFVVPSILRATG